MDHKTQAIKLFNQTWDLIDKQDRTHDDDALMINIAHASLYHWLQVGTPLNFQRGEWLLAHVYSLLKMPDAAKYHAHRCFQLTMDHKIDDFDLSFAYEALARAYLITHEVNASQYLRLAYDSLDQIKDDEDREYTKTQLDELQKKFNN